MYATIVHIYAPKVSYTVDYICNNSIQYFWNKCETFFNLILQFCLIFRFQATKRIRDMESALNDRIKHGEMTHEINGSVIQNWHIPILAMTADVIQATHEECLKCGMDGYVSKPFEGEQLYREVARFFKPNTKLS
jgi:hypothetical protein